jgi:phosphatidylinositol 3-kinase
MRCIDWRHDTELKIAMDMMQKWEKVEISDALELLSKGFSENVAVRDYAVSILENANNEVPTIV